MKYPFPDELSPVRQSLPPRGAWIEILVFPYESVRGNESLPPRGAWIEIKVRAAACFVS